jgi:flagellar biosynthetic protein FlhB
MAENSFQDKTEQATPKRLADARKEGNVAKSMEFNSVLILLFGLMTLYFFSGSLFGKLHHGFRIFYQEFGHATITQNTIQYYLILGIKSFVTIVAPVVVVLTIVGIGSNVAQIGLLLTLKPITPDLNKINPLPGFKRFVSLKSFAELAKGILKLTILGIISYQTIKGHQDEYLLLMHQDVQTILFFIVRVMFQIAMRATVALFILAVMDLLYQRWQYKKDLKMTKQEVKDEQKQAEGDPLVKGQIRSLQLARARERMMEKVPQADVVVTNPTRLAVALKYNPEDMGAPVVLAKGARLIAQRIKEIAIQNDIPIYENKPLAQSLFKMCEIGKEIPFELFHAVAEVFAYVYQMKKK